MRPYNTIVTTPATDTKLIDTNILRVNLNIPEQGSRSDELERSATAAAEIVQHYCDRIFYPQTYQSSFFQEGESPPYPLPVYFHFNEYPLASVVLFEYGDIEAGVFHWKTENFRPEPQVDFRFDSAAGVLTYLNNDYHQYLRITYEAGYSNIPADLIEVVLELTRDLFLRRARESAIEQESIPDQASASYFETTELLSMSQKRVLDTYRNIWSY